MSSELRICLIRKAVRTQLRALNKVMCAIIRWQQRAHPKLIGRGDSIKEWYIVYEIHSSEMITMTSFEAEFETLE
jgi:hypothetical protein